MAYGKSKDLAKKIQSDKVLRDKAFKIASDPKYDGYQRGLASMVYKFFDKKSGGGRIINEPNYQLADELHKPVIKKIKKRKVYSSFRDNIWGVHLPDMQSLSKFNNGYKYLLCAIDLFSKYAWTIPFRDKKFTELENKIPNTNDLVKKTDYNSKITEIENKSPDISVLATKAALTTVENKIPSITNLATKTALTTIENKIPSITGLVKKQIIILRLLILKTNLLTIIMINMLLLQSLILQLLMFLIQD